MPAVVQVAVVLLTVALVALCVFTIRALSRIEKAVDRIGTTAEQLGEAITEARGIAHEAHEVMEIMGDAASRIQRVTTRFEGLSERAIAVSRTVIDEVAAPVGMAAAVVRGVRSGLGLIASRLTHAQKPKTNHGGQS
ncbi:MAG TPA: hypothetical protein VFQ05_07275 [Candidatus Eisenbacteria bacterium]|nr:hypothetical protein [Candidatus Eisenbacteria bacterium]